MINGGSVISIDRARKMWRIAVAEGYIYNSNLDE